MFRSQNIHFDGLRVDDIVCVDAETHESISNSKPHAGKTYRELLDVAGIPHTDGNFYLLGRWLGNEGDRADSFPDATPENMPGWDFPEDFLEDCEDVLDQEEEDE